MTKATFYLQAPITSQIQMLWQDFNDSARVVVRQRGAVLGQKQGGNIKIPECWYFWTYGMLNSSSSSASLSTYWKTWTSLSDFSQLNETILVFINIIGVVDAVFCLLCLLCRKSAESPTPRGSAAGKGAWTGVETLVPRLPCPSPSAGPTAWTPASRPRHGSRSDTAASPCRCAGTARIPGPSPRARVPPRSRSRVRDRVRVLTSWRSAQAVKLRHRCWVRELLDPTTTLGKVKLYCACSDFRVDLQL